MELYHHAQNKSQIIIEQFLTIGGSPSLAEHMLLLFQ